MKYTNSTLELSYVLAPSDDQDFIGAECLWLCLKLDDNIHETQREMVTEAYLEHIDRVFVRYSDPYYGGENWDNPRHIKSRLEG